jgi:hypothetical protein
MRFIRNATAVVRLLLIVVVLAGIVVTALITATPASAATGRSNPPSGPGYVWGIPITSLPACPADVATMVAAGPAEGGGWDDRTLFAYGQQTVSYPGTYPRPQSSLLWEPCYYAAGTNALQRLRIPYLSEQLNYNTPPPSSAGADIGYGSNLAGSGALTTMECAFSEWSTTTPTTVNTSINAGNWGLGGAGNAGGAGQVNPQWGSAVSNGLWSGSSGCSFLQSIDLQVCVGRNVLENTHTGADAVECSVHTWTAERWFQESDYPATDGLYDICQHLSGTHADCVYIDPPDDLSLDVVCAYPPELVMEWGNWSWLPDTIEHYARCLFNPPGGWDRQGLITNSWETSAFTDAGDVLAATTDAFTFSEGCGIILDFGGVDAMPGATGGVNSCDWSAWSPIVRTGLAVIMSLGFGWWAIQFVVHTLAALFRAVPMIDPVTYSTMIYGAVPPGGD